jgi:TrmH family RNA methyltransferase
LKTVTSSANGAVKRARKLLSKKGRDTDDAFLIEGFILIEEAVRSGADIGEVFVRGPGLDGDANEDSASERMGELGLDLSARAVILDAPVFDTLTDTVTPKDVIAVVRKPRPPAEKGDALLVLDRIQDPGNVGTLLRTADARGMDGVVCV